MGQGNGYEMGCLSNRQRKQISYNLTEHHSTFGLVRSIVLLYTFASVVILLFCCTNLLV